MGLGMVIVRVRGQSIPQIMVINFN